MREKEREAAEMRARLDEFSSRAAQEKEHLHRKSLENLEKQQTLQGTELHRAIAAGFEVGGGGGIIPHTGIIPHRDHTRHCRHCRPFWLWLVGWLPSF